MKMIPYRTAILFFLAITVSSVFAESSSDRDGPKWIPGTDCFFYPNAGTLQTAANTVTFSTSLLMNAATEKVAFNTYLFINGRPSTAKSCTAAGGCSIKWLAGTISGFEGADDSIDIGIQDVSTAALPTQPDGTYGVKGTFVGNVDPPTTAAWNTSDMETDGDDTSYSHGDLISVVFDMTACNGCSITVSGMNNTSTGHIPNSSLYTGTWASINAVPNFIITFDDGTIGWGDGSRPMSSWSTTAYNQTSTPDERALVFSLPFDFVIDQVWAKDIPGANADFEMDIYANATSATPTLLSRNSQDDHWLRAAASDAVRHKLLTTPVYGYRGVSYAISMKPTTNNGITTYHANVADASYLAAWGGTSAVLGTRTNGTDDAGPTFDLTTTAVPLIGARICAVGSR